MYIKYPGLSILHSPPALPLAVDLPVPPPPKSTPSATFVAVLDYRQKLVCIVDNTRKRIGSIDWNSTRCYDKELSKERLRYAEILEQASARQIDVEGEFVQYAIQEIPPGTSSSPKSPFIN